MYLGEILAQEADLHSPIIDPLIEITGISCDSRTIATGNLFVAIAGTRHDGNAFIADAIEKGARVIISDREETEHCTDVVMLHSTNPARIYARLAARFYGQAPMTVCITGTNGKSSGVDFFRQFARMMDTTAVSMGTIGITAGDGQSITAEILGDETPALTTADAGTLHRALAALTVRNVHVVALEASSHGLAQHRLDGLTIPVAGFSGFSRDHLDYHGTMDAYFAAKSRLFSELLSPDGIAVINTDSDAGRHIASLAAERGIRILDYGRAAHTLRLLESIPCDNGQWVRVSFAATEAVYFLPLMGEFQAENVLLAALLWHAVSGVAIGDVLAHMSTLSGVTGRLEALPNSPIVVDYAHTPDALSRALLALRTHTSGSLRVLFGCGGNRDPGKRALMGEVACALAERVYITDDNPRREDPARIRADIMARCNAKAINIPKRDDAIHHALTEMQDGDILLIAGKGHEQGQIIADTVIPFDDKAVAARLWDHQSIGEPIDDQTKSTPRPLWTVPEIVAALWPHSNRTDTPRQCHGAKTGAVNGVSIDTRTLQAGEVFFALKGPTFDGNAFIAKAYDSGASMVIASAKPKRADTPATPTLVVNDTTVALNSLATRARARLHCPVIALTGSVGKTGTKDMLRLVLHQLGKTAATQGNLNNHWGVPLSLARMERDNAYTILEMGMNAPNEIAPLSRLARPHVALITTVAGVHLERFADEAAIADAKAEIFNGLEPRVCALQSLPAVAVIPRDNEHHARLCRHLKARTDTVRIITFGDDAAADVRLDACTAEGTGSRVTARVMGETLSWRVGVAGVHLARNSLGVAAVLVGLGMEGDTIARVMNSLSDYTIPRGRGDMVSLHGIRDGRHVPYYLIDDSYNASPPSMRSALDTLCHQAQTGRKVAILGEMLELGASGPARHDALMEQLKEAGVVQVYACGALMQAPFHRLPSTMQGAWALTHDDLSPAIDAFLSAQLCAKDYILIKGSYGSGVHHIAERLRKLR